MATDWQSVRRACVQVARRRGLRGQDAEDAAQDAILRTLEHEVDEPQRYALVVSGRVAIEMLEVQAREVELVAEHERSEPSDQLEHVAATQLAFLLRVRMRGELVDLVDASGGRGRQQRLRARWTLAAALSEGGRASPPLCEEGGVGQGAGSPHAGRLTRGQKK